MYISLRKCFFFFFLPQVCLFSEFTPTSNLGSFILVIASESFSFWDTDISCLRSWYLSLPLSRTLRSWYFSISSYCFATSREVGLVRLLSICFAVVAWNVEVGTHIHWDYHHIPFPQGHDREKINVGQCRPNMSDCGMLQIVRTSWYTSSHFPKQVLLLVCPIVPFELLICPIVPLELSWAFWIFWMAYFSFMSRATGDDLLPFTFTIKFLWKNFLYKSGCSWNTSTGKALSN